MQPSKEQIAAAARLVPGVMKDSEVAQMPDGSPAYWVTQQPQHWWQPWADTEAGRSDALVLLAAVVSRFHVMDGPTFHRLAHHEGYLNDALRSGNVQQIQAATFAAAAAIGQHMEQSNESVD